MVADAWNVLTQDNLKKAGNKLLSEERNETPEKDETDDNPDNDLEENVEMFLSIPGFSEYDREDTESWLQNDIDDHGYQFMTEDEIVNYLQDNDEMSDEEEDECGNIHSENESGPSNEEAYTALTTAMAWYEKQTESCPTQLLLLKRRIDNRGAYSMLPLNK
uniref:Uncharacterized protein n=1 Tax=Timema tahoe TaxID=61484 RepID=A0A7R9FI55_9NEOP|nr:unnamed protein product [Timema tahoe]